MSTQLIFAFGVFVSLLLGFGLLLTVREFQSGNLDKPRDSRFPL